MSALAYWSSGLAVVEPRHFHGMLHEAIGMAANEIADGPGNTGVTVQQGTAYGLFEGGRYLADRQIEAVGLVAGEGVPLDGHRMFDRRQPGERVHCGVDEVVGCHEAVLKLARFATGSRVGLQMERRA